ncbi:hypothetical protein OMAG_002676 [Candidatus Omnitrophus magneticus]|uniref:Uncharacterized protein n=1 Tax=Candidatus Omnitrophus magneticus TaxID=1609969 RepID=A0A0F0CPV4_9BACT|nr:hypothetical protein OMAG_002676 [Candidatus Omnitrophus magneticus]
MPYDSKLDVCAFTKSVENESSRLTVSVYSYNKGQEKLQITREIKDNQGEYKFSKLGRMTKEEVNEILPMIQEALKKMS